MDDEGEIEYEMVDEDYDESYDEYIWSDWELEDVIDCLNHAEDELDYEIMNDANVDGLLDEDVVNIVGSEEDWPEGLED